MRSGNGERMGYGGVAEVQEGRIGGETAISGSGY
jgi:hypothetical protein